MNVIQYAVEHTKENGIIYIDAKEQDDRLTFIVSSIKNCSVPCNNASFVNPDPLSSTMNVSRPSCSFAVISWKKEAYRIMIADKIKNARTILYYITIIIVGIICTYKKRII